MRYTQRLALLAVLILGAAAASGHAVLDRADPRVGSTLRSAPREIVLSFTESLEPGLSTLSVTDASGQRVDAGDVRVSENVMRVALRALGAGTYRVTWRILSVDAHRTEGSFSFEIRQ